MTDEKKIRDMVRRVVYRTVGREDRSVARGGSRLVTADELRDAPAGSTYSVPHGALITPLARQAAMERGVRLVDGSEPTAVDECAKPQNAADRVVAVGADHGGYELKDRIVELLATLDIAHIDCGTNGPESVDYPDIALAVAGLVASGKAWRGILVDGAGIGSCMAANKVPGVRAALCYDEATAVNSREHNHANVLTLGAGLIGPSLARRIVTTWLETPAGGGRHKRRVDKITEIEQRYAGPVRGSRS